MQISWLSRSARAGEWCFGELPKCAYLRQLGEGPQTKIKIFNSQKGAIQTKMFNFATLLSIMLALLVLMLAQMPPVVNGA